MRERDDQIKTQNSMLRYSDAALSQLLNSAGQGVFRNIADSTEASSIQSVMKERSTNGYALVRHRSARGSGTSSKAYDWTSRCLNLATVEAELFRGPDGLAAETPSEWRPPVQPILPSSMAGIQLNDTTKYLEILLNPSVNTPPSDTNIPR